MYVSVYIYIYTFVCVNKCIYTHTELVFLIYYIAYSVLCLHILCAAASKNVIDLSGTYDKKTFLIISCSRLLGGSKVCSIPLD